MKTVIVGNGIAGVTAAKELRGLDQDVEIEIHTSEPHHFYFRPRLPALVAGEVEMEDIAPYDDAWFDERGIDVQLGSTVRSVKPQTHTLIFDDGRESSYDRLLLATGAAPFIPPINGADQSGVSALRSAGDAFAIRERADHSERAVVIGGGLLGLETARGLVQRGLEVTVLEFAPWLLPRQTDEAGAAFLTREIKELGISVVTGAETEAILGSGEVSGVRLKDGRTFDADVVIVSTGVRSRLALAEGTEIETDRAMVVDGGMRTAAPDIWAAGDVAEYDGMVWGIIPVALEQARTAARFIAGDEDRPYEPVVPSNTLKITGIDLFSAGVTSCDEEDCTEMAAADENARCYRKVVIRDGSLVGAIVIGSRKGVLELGEAVQEGRDVSGFGEDIVSESFDFKGALG